MDKSIGMEDDRLHHYVMAPGGRFGIVVSVDRCCPDLPYLVFFGHGGRIKVSDHHLCMEWFSEDELTF